MVTRCILLALQQGSWKLALRNSFKNFRRDYPASATKKSTPSSSACHNAEPPHKRIKLFTGDDRPQLDEGEYEEAIVKLQAEYKKSHKGGRNQATVKDLMDKTMSRRRKWIEEERPLVSDAIKKFPCLSTSRGVSPNFGRWCRYNSAHCFFNSCGKSLEQFWHLSLKLVP